MKLACTGITGTFGRALAKRVLADNLATRLVGISRDELKQSEMAEAHATDEPLRLFLGDVRDCDRLQEAFYQCDTVVHAAALKRVDAIAYNPGEVVKTNIIGTENVIRAALAAGVQRVLVISSDKAVAPLNIYGASKLMGEQIATSSNAYTYPRGMKVSVLRYGNVLGSRGSVVYTWKKQIAARQPITITNFKMMRFMLTIDTGVALALAALERMIGGEVFVPILPSATMADMALALVADEMPPYGYPTQEIGLRAGGEKIVEALLSDEEPSRALKAGQFYVVKPHVHSWCPAWWEGDAVDPALKYVSDGSHGLMTRAEIQVMLREAGL